MLVSKSSKTTSSHFFQVRKNTNPSYEKPTRTLRTTGSLTKKKTSFKRLRMSKKFILNGSHGNKKQTKETKKGDKFDDTSQNLQKSQKNTGIDNLNISI